MSEEIIPTEPDEIEISGEPMTMFETWMKAVTSPSEASYIQIISDPTMSAGKAYGWLALSSVIGGIVLVIGQSLFGLASGLGIEGILSSFLSLIFVIPIGIVISMVGATIITGISTGVAKILGGEGSFTELLYATAAYSSPIGIVSSIFSAIPIVNLIAIPISFYALFLNIIAVKATHQFGWGKAIASSVVIYIFLFVLLAICVIIFLTIMGPTIGDMFQTIINDLQ